MPYPQTMMVGRWNWLLLLAPLVLAASCLVAQDKIHTEQEHFEGAISGITSDGSPKIKLVNGAETVVPRDKIKLLEMPEPAVLAKWREESVKIQLAPPPPVLAIAKKWRGLPIEWAALASDTAVASLLVADETSAASEWTKETSTIYANTPWQIVSSLMKARLAIAQSKWADAKIALAPLQETYAKSISPPDQIHMLLAQGFYLAGQVAEAENDKSTALEQFLKVSLLLPEGANLLAKARLEAGRLQQEGIWVP